MKTIKIPKVDKPVSVEIYKVKTTKYEIVLCKQKIAGIIVPRNTTISIETGSLEFNHDLSFVEVPVYNINRLLKFLYLEELRKGV